MTLSGQTFWYNTDAQTSIMPSMKIIGHTRNNDNPMRLDVLNVDIKVVGQIAITTLDMTFYNSNARTMEGEFNFPLGEGQTVSRFALDINGSLREGVVVEKEQGRKTFEAIVRKGIDPGLLEKTKGNNFRARVYPLPANGSRRIVIAYEQILSNKGNYDLYLLPLNISEPIGKFAIRAEVVKNQVNLETEQNQLTNLSFKNWNNSYIANLEEVNYTPNKQLALSFPHVNELANVFTSSQNSNGNAYFYLNISPKQFSEEKTLPKTISLFWDNSSSIKNRNIEKELSLLESYLKKIGSVNVTLIPFNIKTEKEQNFIITNGNCTKLTNAIKTLVNDGGTSLGCLNFAKYKSDEILLFTDGISNIGKAEPIMSEMPVITLNSSLSANHSLLTYLAQKSGGIYINLSKLTPDEALTSLNTNNYHFISAKILNGSASDIYPSMPCQFTRSFSMCGIMKSDKASLQLNFGFGSRIVYSKIIEINAENVADSTLLRRIWAEKKIEELSLNESLNKKEILKTGKDFGIVTQNTSLIVLENLSDYVQYQIIPPKELQDAYYQQISLIKNEADNIVKDQIEKVVTLSNEQSTWWNTNYKYIPTKKITKNKSQRRGGSVVFNAPTVVDSVVEESINEEPPADLNDASAHEEVFMVVEEPDNADFAVKRVESNSRNADIQINAWDPQSPYLKVLQYAAKGEEYKTYIRLKDEYSSTPAFYIDAADFFAKMNKKDTAYQILSNLAELQLESPQLLRILGKKLMDFALYNQAVDVFEKVLEMKKEEPQSYRDLGLAQHASGNSQQAIKTLYEIIKTNNDSRFPSIELIVLNEINAIIASNPKLDYSFIDKRLVKKEPVDIRVVLTWDTDNCDMDLWVTDPVGEKCFYSYNLTQIGGKMSKDFTNGYGPEEFMIKNALSGNFNVQVNYYGSHSQSVLAPVNLHIEFFTNFGKPNQKKQEISLRLDNQKDIIDIGNFKFSTKVK